MKREECNQDFSNKEIHMRTSFSQAANDSDQTAFDTFVQQDSVDFSGTAS